MSSYAKYLLLGCFILLLSSCIKDSNPDIPAYIYVPNIQFSAGDPLVEGSANQKFSNAWIFVDGQLIGANNFPVLLPGIIIDTASTQEVKVFAAVDVNGISSTKAIYPFFDPYITRLNLQQGKIDTVLPVQLYKSDVKFILIENFESPGVVFGNDIDLFPDSDIIKQSNEVFEGLYSGQLYVDTLNPECYVSTTFRYSNLQRPSTASPVYLEMNYKTNVPVSIGLIAHRNIGSDEVLIKGGVNAIEGWNKIYFDITTDIFGANADSYSVFLRASISGTAVTDAKIYFDNIKLIHF